MHPEWNPVMSDIAKNCLVSGADGFVTVTPAGRVILTETQIVLRGEDVDRIADDVGVDVALRTVASSAGTAALVEGRSDGDGGPAKLTLTGRVAADRAPDGGLVHRPHE